ncbi:hypothetical protein ACFXPI_14925 [Streptomyces sp. NPDC059104]|uniref:hypothetical protein n=1 Tax=Streptomyces sp. NPDC059104 TaxID=3346729 RepID=UPI0036C92111
MPLPQPHMPRSHRARRGSRRAAVAPAAGKRAVRRPPLLPVAGRLRTSVVCASLAALVSLGVAARAGALTHLWDFLDFGSGVLSLVSLTSTVLWGLVATDRVLLGSGHRLLAQGVHRGLAVAGLGFLALHIWVKVAEGHTGATSALVPFTDANRPVVIGLGTLAGYLFVSVAVSGALRSVFATNRRSMWWRALHIGAYPAWGASLVHGLKAGRPADLWVTAAYVLGVAGVMGLLAVRLRTRRREASAPASAPQSVTATRGARGPRSRGYPVREVPLAGLRAERGGGPSGAPDGPARPAAATTPVAQGAQATPAVQFTQDTQSMRAVQDTQSMQAMQAMQAMQDTQVTQPLQAVPPQPEHPPYAAAYAPGPSADAGAAIGFGPLAGREGRR